MCWVYMCMCVHHTRFCVRVRLCMCVYACMRKCTCVSHARVAYMWRSLHALLYQPLVRYHLFVRSRIVDPSSIWVQRVLLGIVVSPLICFRSPLSSDQSAAGAHRYRRRSFINRRRPLARAHSIGGRSPFLRRSAIVRQMARRTHANHSDCN